MDSRTHAYDLLDKAGAHRLWVLSTVDLGRVEGWSVGGSTLLLRFHREDSSFSYYVPPPAPTWARFAEDLDRLRRRP